jgi:hypothetical protein
MVGMSYDDACGSGGWLREECEGLICFWMSMGGYRRSDMLQYGLEQYYSSLIRVNDYEVFNG